MLIMVPLQSMSDFTLIFHSFGSEKPGAEHLDPHPKGTARVSYKIRRLMTFTRISVEPRSTLKGRDKNMIRGQERVMKPTTAFLYIAKLNCAAKINNQNLFRVSSEL
jgi:hypothetical protein